MQCAPGCAGDACRIGALAALLAQFRESTDLTAWLGATDFRVSACDFVYQFGVHVHTAELVFQLLRSWEQRTACAAPPTSRVALLCFLRHLRHGNAHRDDASWWGLSEDGHMRLVNRVAERLYAAIAEVSRDVISVRELLSRFVCACAPAVYWLFVVT